MLRTLQVPCQAVYNDQLNTIEGQLFQGAILSPGPGLPDESGELMSFIKTYAPTLPMLGICLGHQAIAQVYGGKLINIAHPRHGKSLPIELDTSQPIFKGLDETIEAGLYHSWQVDANAIPPELATIPCWRNVPMALAHRQYPLIGLQFHPESYATPQGLSILSNWLLTL